MKRYYMACLDLHGRRAVVVGGGPIALEETLGLLDAGATVTVVAPEVVPQFHELDVTWRPVPLRIAPPAQRVPGHRQRATVPSTSACSRATRSSGHSSATSPTCPSSATSSCRRSSAVTRSWSPSRPAAPRPRSPTPPRPDRRARRAAPRRPGAAAAALRPSAEGTLFDVRRPARVLRAARGEKL